MNVAITTIILVLLEQSQNKFTINMNHSESLIKRICGVQHLGGFRVSYTIRQWVACEWNIKQ